MEKSLSEMIEHYNGKLYNLCYQIITESDNVIRDFEFLCKNYHGQPKEKSIEIKEYITADQMNFLRNLYGIEVNSFIVTTINKVNNKLLDSNNFYSDLWNHVTAFHKDMMEQAFAMYWILVDKRIPFRCVGQGINLPDEKYRQILLDNRNSIEDMLYINELNCVDSAEEASLFLNTILKAADRESQIALLSFLLTMVKNNWRGKNDKT